ncbi:MAG TPA: hypothetical protein VFM93_09285 [Candidatus Limnocylindria bacterium]|nr:hypothetical protein [Candidatus Limnocylindria bacterium]
MKELLQGRRFGFAPRPFLGQVAIGLALGATLLDLMAWGGWGARQTTGLVAGAYWLTVGTATLCALALLTGLAEMRDAAEEDSGYVRIDVIAALVATLIFAASAVLRALELSAAAAPPAPFLLSIGGLLLLLVDGVIATALYAGREWAELDEEDVEPQRHRRRRTAAR